MTTRSEDGKKETDESFQDIWTRNGSRERCNEHPYFEDLNGSGKIPKPISLIRQKFPRLRAKRERERERERSFGQAPIQHWKEWSAQPRERIAMHYAFHPEIEHFYLFEKDSFGSKNICHLFFFHSFPPLLHFDEISIERVAHV